MLQARNRNGSYRKDESMQNANSLLNQFLGGGNSGIGGLGGLLEGKKGLATGVVAGGLAGLLLGGKKPKKIAKTALTYGGAAVVGGLAYSAWKNWQAKQVPAATPSPRPVADQTAFLPAGQAAQEELAVLLLKAMVAAAKADGHIDTGERAHITSRLRSMNLSAEEQAFLQKELSKPVDMNAFASVANTPEVASEIYLASLLVLDVDHEAERQYLATLAGKLGLAPALVAELHRSVEKAGEEDPEIVSLFA
jgi:uncharacterized membrane protein YebE (DUF533 family)